MKIAGFLSIAALTISIVFGAVSPATAQVVVTTTSGGIGGPGCTLRDAIKTADQELPYGGCSVPATNPNVVSLQSGQTYLLTEVDNFSRLFWVNGLPVVSDYVRIEGNGATIERAAAANIPDFRFFYTSGLLELSNLTLRNGRASLKKDSTLDFTGFAIGDTFTGTSMSPLLPINDGSEVGMRVMEIFSSADFGSFDPNAGSPEIAVESGVPFGIPKAICPRPNAIETACTGALNLTFGPAFEEPASNIRFDVSSDDSLFVDVIISLDIARTQLAYASFVVDALPNTPHRIGLTALSFNESPDGTGAPVDVSVDTEIYALAINSGADPGGLRYDNFQFNVDYIDRRGAIGVRPCSDFALLGTIGYGLGGAVLASSDRSPGAGFAQLSVDNVIFDGNFAKCGGGAIGSVDDQGFSVVNSEFRNNAASTKRVSPRLLALTNYGGAVFQTHLVTEDPGGSISESIFSNNTALNGGAVGYIGFGSERLRLSDIEFTGNQASISGGAMYYRWRVPEALDIGGVVLDDSSFIGNQAGEFGGGAYFQAGTGSATDPDDLQVRNSTFSGNQAAWGGGIAVGVPAATFDPNISTLALHNSTVSGNVADIGGGIFVDNDSFPESASLTGGGKFASYFSTITDNSASIGGGIAGLVLSETTLNKSIIANQLSGADCSIDGSGISLGSNMDSDGSCGLVAANDLPLSIPLIGPLQGNGGPTNTHALLPESPAIDVIPVALSGDPAASDCVDGAEDQRGEARPQGTGCDMGSYEATGALNMPPLADAGGPYVGTAGLPVALDASDSMDPDGVIVSYLWNFGDGSSGTGVNPSHSFATEGVYTISLTVTDDSGDTGSTTAIATISAANLPPVANPGGPYVGTEGLSVMLNGGMSFDPDGTIELYEWDLGDGSTASGVMPDHVYVIADTYTVELTVTDNSGETNSASTEVVVSRLITNMDPDCSGAFPSTAIIWPPNHKFVPIQIRGVSDADGDIVTITVNSIFQDEPVDSIGDGKTARDGRGIGLQFAEVRAERSGAKKVPGNGRVYHIGFTATDTRGGTCSGSVSVGVPHDKMDSPVDDGPLYDSTAETGSGSDS